MSFIPEKTPFVSLPTALKGRIDPYELAVLWVLQSYYPNIWPSYATIAKDAKIGRNKVVKVIKSLCENGWLEKIGRVDDSGHATNAYRVTVWHELKVAPPSSESLRNTTTHPELQNPSKQPQYFSDTSISQIPDQSFSDTGGGISEIHELKQIKLKQITKTNNIYTDEFNDFWNQYQKIKKRASGQSKKLTYQHYKKLSKKIQSQLKQALLRAIADQNKIEKDGGFVTCFPNAFKWLRDGYYEAFLYVQKPKSKLKLESRNNIPF